MYRFERIVPLIGATVPGPLGIVHLPRMWLKSVLSAAGLLVEGYFDNYKGFNQRVVDGIGLEPEPWFAFLATMPTYPQAEDYVKAHATKLDPASIAAVNHEILTYLRPEENAAAVRARAGLDDSTFRDSAQLLNFDDWTTLHQTLVAHHAAGIEPLVPMISSSQAGMFGVPHLPRMWIKAFLGGINALPEGWKTGPNCGFDNNVATTMGLDLAATCAYIHRELPTYVQFEGYVRDHIPQPDLATKAQWTGKFLGGKKNDESAVGDLAEAGVADRSLRGTILLNDLVDWKHMHDYAVARQVARA